MGTSSNRGVGALITVEAGQLVQTKQTSAGASYASMHSIDQMFGLLDIDTVDKITVQCPTAWSDAGRDARTREIMAERLD